MPASEALEHAWLDELALGRRLSQLDSDPDLLVKAVLRAYEAPAMRRIGITGSPGVGKSTLLNQLLGLWHQEPGRRTAVVAVDPTSALGSGAVLGDRFRISSSVDGVFFRSAATRGSLGGISPVAVASVALLEEAGFQRIVIESVGLGQVGSDLRALVDTLVVLVSPESGDALQMLKAGPLELGDVFVVNKADRAGSDLMLAQLKELTAHLPPRPGRPQPLLLSTNALSGEGVEQLHRAIQHQEASLLPGASQTETIIKLRLSSALRTLVDIGLESMNAGFSETVPEPHRFPQYLQNQLRTLGVRLQGWTLDTD